MRARKNTFRAVTAVGAVGALVAAASAFGASSPTPAGLTGTTVLTTDVVPSLAAAADLGAADSAKVMRVAVGLTVDKEARDAAYQAIYTPGSPQFHHFYTPTSFNAAFHVNRDLAAHVESVVTADGLTTTYVSPDGSYLLLSGTTAQVEKTFGVTEKTYRFAGSSSTFTANSSGPTVPVGVAGVLGLSSLDTFHTAASEASAAKVAAEKAAPTKTDVAPAQGTCVGGTCTGVLDPQDLWSAYDEPKNDLGAGGKVAIFGEGQLDTVVSDLRMFETEMKFRTVPVRRVLVGDDNSDNAGQEEWDLDEDASTGMSPDMQQLSFYFGSDLSDASIGGTYSAWVNDTDGPLTGNSSFGGPEQLEFAGGFILDTILQQGTMEGRTMFVSAGDGGGSCLPGANGVVNDQVPCVEYPASSAYVVGIGGAVLYTDGASEDTVSTAKRVLEYSWTYSGGGQSMYLAAPSYQSADFPGTAIPCALGPNQGKACRGVPDVASLSGDITTNAYTIVASGADTTEGGTSLSSPLWAGMWTRVLAAHPATGCTTKYDPAASLGFAQPLLYALGNDPAEDAKVFFDIGGTTNSQPSGNEQQVAIPRNPIDVTGYDYVSGLGTPQSITQMADALDCTTDPTPVTADTTPADLDITIFPTLAGCGINGVLNPADPVGDEVPATPVTAAMDITTVDITSDVAKKTTTFTMDVSDLGTDPAGPFSYAFEFNYDNAKYAVVADYTAASTSYTLYSRAITVTPIGLGVEAPPTSLATDLTGTVNDPATPNVVTVTMTWDDFNTAAAPTTPFGVGSTLKAITMYTGNGTAATNVPVAYDAAPVDQAEYLQCSYTVQATDAAPVVIPPDIPVTAPVTGPVRVPAAPVAAPTATSTLASTGLAWELPALGLGAVLVGGVLRRRGRKL